MFRKRIFWTVPLILIALAVLLHRPVLIHLGDWLAPVGDQEGDAAILEGTQVAVSRGVNLGISLCVLYGTLVLSCITIDATSILESIKGVPVKE